MVRVIKNALPIIGKSQIKQILEPIRRGKLVIFPTETVYGLGGNAYDKKSIDSIFEIKKRPYDKPLIIHLADIAQAQKLAFLDQIAYKLMEAFWPGPLTIVAQKKKNTQLAEQFDDIASIALRMPANETAILLLKSCKIPLAASSANISGRMPAAMKKDLKIPYDDRIVAVIEGKDRILGIPSTIIDITTKPPVLLRAGSIKKNDIECVISQKIAINNRVY